MFTWLVAGLIGVAQPVDPRAQSAPTQPGNQVSLAPQRPPAHLVRLGDAFGGVEVDEGEADAEGVLGKIAATLSAVSQSDAQVRLRLLLASASLRLSRSAEPAASRYLLGVQDEEDRSRWSEVARLALAELGRAGEILDHLPDPTSEEEEAEHDRSAENIELLESFARMFLALAEPEEQDRATLAQALSDLSAYLEVEDDRLARAATLWQAVALRRLGRPDRAASLLSLPLRAPGSDPLELFVRLERLACLADRGDLEAAMVLALRMEEACTRWYQDQLKQAEARRSCLWVRLRFFERYVQRAQEQRMTDQLDGWRGLIDQIQEALIEEGRPATVARLGQTMPILVEAEEALLAAERLWTEPVTPPAGEQPPAEEQAADSAPEGELVSPEKPATQAAPE